MAIGEAYQDSWDRTHVPTPENDWQESDWLTFYDPVARVGGICRIGQKPNKGTGQPGIFVFALGGYRYFADDVGGRLDVPITEGDRRIDGYRCGNLSVDLLGPCNTRFNFDYPEVQGSVNFVEGFYTPRSWTAYDIEDVHQLFSDGHLEQSGRVRGKFSINGMDYEVDCLGHRDRSWGVRRPYVGRVKRIMTSWATLGPDYSHAVLRFEPLEGTPTVQGFVMRNGVAEEVVAMRHISTVDVDFVSGIEGRVILTVESGEEIKIHCKLAQAHAARAAGSAFSGPGTFEMAGKTGFCVYSAMANPARGSHVATADEVSLAVVKKGLSRAVDHPVLDW